MNISSIENFVSVWLRLGFLFMTLLNLTAAILDFSAESQNSQIFPFLLGLGNFFPIFKIIHYVLSFWVSLGKDLYFSFLLMTIPE